MDKILIADGDKEFVQAIKQGLDKTHQFEVLLAEDGRQAIEILDKIKISVLVTDLNTPVLDGLELLANITRKHPGIPCIVMTEYGKPWFRKRMAQQETLYHLEKPFQIGALVSAIFVGLNLRDEGLNYKGMKIASILPLIEILQKTCRLEVMSSGKGKGFLYFDEGVLIDAHLPGMSSEKAAREIAKWERITIRFSDLPRRRTRTRVKTNLMDMIDATWLPEKEEPLQPDTENHAEPLILSNGSDGIDDLSGILSNHLDRFQSIKGYKAVAVLDKEGNIVASDQVDEALDLAGLAAGVVRIFSVSDKTAVQIGFDRGHAFILHTGRGVLLYMAPETESPDRVQLVGVTEPDGNWFHMRVQLEKLFSRIMETDADPLATIPVGRK